MGLLVGYWGGSRWPLCPTEATLLHPLLLPVLRLWPAAMAQTHPAEQEWELMLHLHHPASYTAQIHSILHLTYINSPIQIPEREIHRTNICGYTSCDKNYHHPAADVRRHLLRSQEGCSSFSVPWHKCQVSFCKLFSQAFFAFSIISLDSVLQYILGVGFYLACPFPPEKHNIDEHGIDLLCGIRQWMQPS